MASKNPFRQVDPIATGQGKALAPAHKHEWTTKTTRDSSGKITRAVTACSCGETR